MSSEATRTAAAAILWLRPKSRPLGSFCTLFLCGAEAAAAILALAPNWPGEAGQPRRPPAAGGGGGLTLSLYTFAVEVHGRKGKGRTTSKYVEAARTLQQKVTRTTRLVMISSTTC